jgi:hypothetical protein
VRRKKTALPERGEVMRIAGAEMPDAVEQYEALRREALEIAPFAPRAQGLALFLTRGLSHWLMALTALAPSRPTRSTDDALPGRPVRLLPAAARN